MELLSTDLELALDRVRFAKSLGFDPDPWQVDLLEGGSSRTLLNITRQGARAPPRP